MTLRSRILSFFSASILFFTIFVAVLHLAFGFQYVVILTDSMEPRINPGDLVVIYPTHHVKPGDIILYRLDLGESSYHITHRVVGIAHDESGGLYYVTRGDNRKYPDPWRVYPDQVVGKVLFVVPYVGRLYYYTPLMITVLFLSLMAFLGYELVRVLLEEEEEKPSERHVSQLRRSRDIYMVRRRARKLPGRGNL